MQQLANTSQETCRQCAAALYPQISPQDFIFAVGQDHQPSNTPGVRPTPVYYVAIFARVTDGTLTTRKLLERGPMSSRIDNAWAFLESRMIRAIDKIVAEAEQKANLASRDRDCRIVFGVTNLLSSASASSEVASAELAPPAYREANVDGSGPSNPLSSKRSDNI